MQGVDARTHICQVLTTQLETVAIFSGFILFYEVFVIIKFQLVMYIRCTCNRVRLQSFELICDTFNAYYVAFH